MAGSRSATDAASSSVQQSASPPSPCPPMIARSGRYGPGSILGPALGTSQSGCTAKA